MKNKIIISTSAVAIILLIIIFFFQRFHKVIENQIAEQVSNSQVLLAETGKVQIEQLFKMAENELISLSNSFPLKKLIAAIGRNDIKEIKLWEAALTDLFVKTTASHDFSLQLRFINDSGMEVVRVDNKNGKIFKVSELQDKSKEFYFSEAMSKDLNQFYLSSITLNREFGKIEVPHREVIRLATPVLENDVKKGIVILNIEMNTIYSIVDDLSDHAWMIDSSGKLLACSLGLPQEAHDNIIGMISGQKESNFLPLGHYRERDQKLVIGYAPVNILDQKWMVVSELPFDEISTIMEKSNSIIIILFVVILVSFVAVLIYIYKLYIDHQRAALKAEMAEDLIKLNKQLEGKSSELESANRSLEEVDKRKTDFLNMVAHDLRTPLTSIRSYSDLLLRYGDRSAKSREGYAEIIKKESVRLSHLIDDFLDISKIEAGGIEYKCEDVDIAEIVKHFVKLFEVEGNIHEIKIIQKVDENLPRIKGDKERLGQVFSNLLSNAIKFTPPTGFITIIASQISINKNNIEEPYIQVSVTDTGIGVPKNAIDKIFEKFVQVNHRDIKSTRGTGLGLSISKEIIEKHGGSIKAESKEGHGTNIIFTLKVSEKNMAFNS